MLNRLYAYVTWQSNTLQYYCSFRILWSTIYLVSRSRLINGLFILLRAYGP